MSTETIPCPTCNGHGTITRERNPVTGRPVRPAPSDTSDQSQTCTCDGPPHRWTAGWCP